MFNFRFIWGLCVGLEHEVIIMVDEDDYDEPEYYEANCWHLSLAVIRLSIVW